MADVPMSEQEKKLAEKLAKAKTLVEGAPAALASMKAAAAKATKVLEAEKNDQ